MDNNSLSHTKWNCKYHIVFAPKYRRKVAYGKIKQDIADILSMLCKRKGVKIIEAEICPDHVHMLVEIPPSISVSYFVGYLKGKSTLMIFERHANLKKFNVDIDLYARNLIEYIVTDLFKRCDICGLWFQEEFYHQPLTGLAHGQSGYALALSKALPYINEGMRLKVTSQIQKCMDYEYNCYDNSEMNLPDYRKLLLKKGGDKSQKKFMYGYCSGILGTALVVSELSEELISFQKKEIWKMNAVQYLKKDILIGNDSLCCGTAGWIDYLASCHKNEEWSDELFKKIIFSINEQGYVFNGLEGVNEISLFKGMSGIGYSVLRYMGKYPSVLL